MMTSSCESLIIALIFRAVAAALALLGVLALDAARSSSSQGRAEGEVDVLLAVETHHVAGDVHHLLAHADVALADEDARVVDGLGQPQLEDLRLQAPLQEVLQPQTQHVIQLHLALVQHANAHEAPQHGVALKQAARVLLLQREQLASSFADLGERVLDAPYFTLV